MSFLTHLYLFSALAIGLPLLFHLIRQTPQGKQVFSSVMFLVPSPPRVTKRSRIEDWWLLLLRALAILLIALAFARPFFRTEASAGMEQGIGKNVAVLLDTSASMQRAGYWDAAVEKVLDRVKALELEDNFTLLTFDERLTTLIAQEDWQQLPVESRISTVTERLEELKPGWHRTKLGEALIQTAEALENTTEEQRQGIIVVVSDLQSGSQWEQIQGYSWPAAVNIEFVPVELPHGGTNGAVQVIAANDQTDNVLRLRVSNSEDAAQDLFHIQWQTTFGAAEVADKAASVSAYVPPGQQRVVRAPEISAELLKQDIMPQRIILTGDDEPFDNTCYVSAAEPWQARIVYLGDDQKSGAKGLRFFLDPVFGDAGQREVTIIDWSPAQQAAEVLPASEQLTMAIVGGTLSMSQQEWLQAWVNAGGLAIFVARDPEQAMALYTLLDVPPGSIEEAEVDGYAMLGNVDLSHPVLKQFDDPRFSNFTKLRFSHFRRFDLATLPQSRVMAAYDATDAPAWLDIESGAGRYIVFTSGWDREDSALAVSSKFVPLMNSILEYSGRMTSVRRQYLVGDTLPLSQLSWEAPQLFVRDPQGHLSQPASTAAWPFEQPGIYKFAATESGLNEKDAVTCAVNLPPEESETGMLSIDALAAQGVPVATTAFGKEIITPELQRQLLNRELEAQQQIWKYLLVGALALLLLETCLGGWLQRRRMATA